MINLHIPGVATKALKVVQKEGKKSQEGDSDRV